MKAHWPVVKEGGLVAIKKRIDIYGSAMIVKEIQQYCNRIFVQNLEDKRTIKLTQASVSIIVLNLDKVENSLIAFLL